MKKCNNCFQLTVKSVTNFAKNAKFLPNEWVFSEYAVSKKALEMYLNAVYYFFIYVSDLVL